VTKLKMLLQIVAILFGLMNIGAAFGFALDRRERRRFLQRMQSPEVGFRVGTNGAMLWRFSLEPLQGELDAPTGPAVELTALLGIPIVRLRAALPDELLAWDLATALGRRHVCSAEGFNNNLTALTELLPPLLGTPRRSSDAARRRSTSATAPPVRSSSARTQRLSTSQGETMEDFVGTAIVLAFIQVAQLTTVRDLAANVSAAAAHFSGVTTPAGRDFGSTQTDFVTLLSPGALSSAGMHALHPSHSPPSPSRAHRCAERGAPVAAACAPVAPHPLSARGRQLGRQQHHCICHGGATCL
jgi:hypothetical protein